MSLRTPLGRVRGLGAAKEGLAHWRAQRWTALALVPLAIWFAASLAAMTGADYATARAWIASPLVAILLVLLIGATFHHAQLGLQVVIEDYVASPLGKLAWILLVKGAALLLGVGAAFSVLKIAFGG